MGEGRCWSCWPPLLQPSSPFWSSLLIQGYLLSSPRQAIGLWTELLGGSGPTRPANHQGQISVIIVVIFITDGTPLTEISYITYKFVAEGPSKLIHMILLRSRSSHIYKLIFCLRFFHIHLQVCTYFETIRFHRTNLNLFEIFFLFFLVHLQTKHKCRFSAKGDSQNDFMAVWNSCQKSLTTPNILNSVFFFFKYSHLIIIKRFCNKKIILL